MANNNNTIDLYTPVDFSVDISEKQFLQLLQDENPEKWNDVIVDYILENDVLPFVHENYDNLDDAARSVNHTIDWWTFEDRETVYYHVILSGMVEHWITDNDGHYIDTIGYEETQYFVTNSIIGKLKASLAI